MEGILIPLGFFACIVLIVYIYYANRNKERMALIEKGKAAEIFNHIEPVSMFSFKIGFFLIGLGLGSILGNLLAVSTMLEEGVAYFAMMTLMGGGSLVVFHLLEKRFIKNLKKLN
jgi:hypothetical protein